MIRILAVILILVLVNAFMVVAVMKAAARLEQAIRRYYIAKLGDEEEKARKEREAEELLIVAAPGSGDGPGSGPGDGPGPGGDGPGMNVSSEGLEGLPEYVLKSEKGDDVFVTSYVAPNVDLGSASFKSSNFRDDYRTMRRMEMLSQSAALQAVMGVQDRSAEGSPSAVCQLHEIIDYDTAFRLSSRPSAEQEQILRETLEPAQVEVLNAYLRSRPEAFDIIDFYGYLEEQAAFEDQTFEVRKAAGSNVQIPDMPGVRLVEDEDLTEGIRIIYKNKLYDYGV